MMRVGSEHITEAIEIPGIDYSTQEAELSEAIGAPYTKVVYGKAHGQDVSSLERQMDVHQANLDKLHVAGQPTMAAETKEVETDETWSEPASSRLAGT
jgi:hypothetical protein